MPIVWWTVAPVMLSWGLAIGTVGGALGVGRWAMAAVAVAFTLGMLPFALIAVARVEGVIP